MKRKLTFEEACKVQILIREALDPPFDIFDASSVEKLPFPNVVELMDGKIDIPKRFVPTIRQMMDGLVDIDDALWKQIANSEEGGSNV